MNRFFLLFLAVFFSCAHAADWPQYLGPNRDATSAETGWNLDWDAKEPRILWKAEVGKGCSSFAVADGKAYVTGNARGRDTLSCFDAETGRKIWFHAIPEKLAPKYYNGGPSATPTVDSGRVYTVTKSGRLRCLDVNTGKVVWQRSYEADFGGRRQTWGWAAAPLIVGEKLLADPGASGASAVALNKMTGELIWKSGNSQPGYASPILHDGRVLFFQTDGLNAYDVETGKLLFTQRWSTKHDVNASIPIPFEGGYFLSSSYGTGSGLTNPAGGGLAWRTQEVALHFQNGVRIGPHLYAVDAHAGSRRAALKCLDLRTGRVAWSEPLGGKMGTLIAVGGKLIVLSEFGELILANPDPAGYDELGRAQVLRKTCWTAPAFANGLIFLRNNDGRAVCVDVR